ncbi:MAG: HNH endonuclease [Phycisphaerales bacterium]|nr:HNH endonuclease [Phycisphaerales bacterium]
MDSALVESTFLTTLFIKNLGKDTIIEPIYYSEDEQKHLQDQYQHDLQSYEAQKAHCEAKKLFALMPRLPKSPDKQVKEYKYTHFPRPSDADLIMLAGQLVAFIQSKLPIDPAIQRAEGASRHISQQVKDAVWRRDQGKCVKCGSNQNLEFDHIIPFARGGSSTARNIQLLCEVCNREKSDQLD